MSSRKRAAAPAKRAPARPKRKRRLGPKAAAERASRLPHHPPYTAALLAQIRHRYEQTPEPIPPMAADLGVAPGSLHRIARRHGWVRRNPVPPPRDVSEALKILAEARALEAADAGAASHLSPLRGERSPAAGGRVRGPDRESERVEMPPHPDPLPACGERERAESAEHTVSDIAASPELSTIERLERAVLAELATIEAMRAAMGTLPQQPVGAARTVRTLNMLTQTLQHLQRLRASVALSEKPIARNHHDDDDDIPADIDEFRRDLARRIDAFVASRTEQRDARSDAAAGAVDQAR